MINQTILNYTILSQIGSGGMGTVYLGKHTNLDRKVAIKVLLPEFAANQDIKNRFINEANTLSKLNHQNIVTLYDFANINDKLYLIMEYAEGTPLDIVIEKVVGAIPEQRCINIFEQILSGFAYAHKKGIVHRDIKPSNIILQTDDTPKILDFGIAKIVEGDVRLTKTGTRMGSVVYMSPEQVLGKEVDYRSDIYSLGITLYEMLSGKLPYDTTTESEFEIQTKIVKEPLKPIRLINPNISERLENIINTATTKDVQSRFQNCDEFKEALKGSTPITINKTLIEAPSYQKTIYQNPSPGHQSYPQKQKRSSAKYYILGLGGIFIIVLIFLLFVILNNNKEPIVEKTQSTVKNETQNTNSFKTPGNETDDIVIKNTLNNWIDAINRKDLFIGLFYSSSVNYYTWGSTRFSKVNKDKLDFFKKWDRINLSIDNVNIQKISDDSYKCNYDKSFETESYSSGKKYSGKVNSTLMFIKQNDKWLISGEYDNSTYYTKKN